jgi:hypothetical protein
VRALIAAPETPIFVSAAGFWEAAIKRVKGRLDFDGVALSQAVIESVSGGCRSPPSRRSRRVICRTTTTIRSIACWWRRRWPRI